jgi:hypothetical protein
MAWARVEVCLGVVLGSLVLVLDEEGDRGAKRDALLDAGLDVNKIFFVPLLQHAWRCGRQNPSDGHGCRSDFDSPVGFGRESAR